jgi:hypothetical protein
MKTHAIDWKTTHPCSGSHKTRCGREAGRAFGVSFGAKVTFDPNKVTCKSCEKAREGRR